MAKCRFIGILSRMFPLEDAPDKVAAGFTIVMFLLLSAVCGSYLAELSVVAGVAGGAGFMAFSLWILYMVQKRMKEDKEEPK